MCSSCWGLWWWGIFCGMGRVIGWRGRFWWWVCNFLLLPLLLTNSKVFCGFADGKISAKTDRLRNHRHRILVLPEPRRGDIERHRGIGRLSKQHHHRQSFAKEPINHGEPKSVIERLQITSNPHECSRLVIHKQDIQTQKYTNIPSRS